MVSLQIRVDLIANGGDFVFCDLVLWTAFLPLGATLSIDSWRRGKAGKLPTRSPVVSWAVLVAILQLVVIYYFNAVHKSGETWIDGTAVYWLAQQEHMVTALGFWMLRLPEKALILTGKARLDILSRHATADVSDHSVPAA